MPLDDQTQAPEEPDEVFIRRCREGDAESFGVLVERHQRRMFNLAYRMLSDREEAADAVQEAFIAAYRAIGTFRGESRFSTWMTSIVLNHSRNRLESRGVKRCRECASIEEASERGDQKVLRQLRSDSETGEEMLERKHIKRRVKECMDALDGEHREVFVLRDMEGMSYEEISSTLSLAGGTVKSRLFRARLAMKDCLSDLVGAVQ